MKKHLLVVFLVGCAYAPDVPDASTETYPTFNSVCRLDNGMGVACTDLTPNDWAWSWMGVGSNGLQSYYCNQKACPYNEKCYVQDDHNLLVGVCE